MIITANHWFKPFGCTTLQIWVEKKILPHMDRHGIYPTGLDYGTTLASWVLRGAWTVTCPCGASEYTWNEGWVMCLSCMNGYSHHRFVRTMFPAKRQQVEDILEFRPLENRNWLIGETLEELIAQNIENGVEVPEWFGHRQLQELTAI